MSEPHVINFPDMRSDRSPAPNRSRRKVKKNAYGCRTDSNCSYLPIICPTCGAEVGLIETDTGKYIVDGNFCQVCGQRLKDFKA